MGVYKAGRPTAFSPSNGKGTEPPKAAGEYRIRDDNNEIVYIGEANNLNRRMKEHIKTGKLKK